MEVCTKMEEVYEFLKKCGYYFLATDERMQPRVRPFGTYLIYGGKLYIQTGKGKPVTKQIMANPKIELCAYDEETESWLRVSAMAIEDPRAEVQQAMLDAFPELKDRYAVNDGNTTCLYLTNVIASFENHNGEKKVVTF